MLYISIVTASIANTLCPTGEVNESFQRQLRNMEIQHLINRSNPRDKAKTPTSPDIIEHGGNMLKGGRNFYRKRIYFGNDKLGNPCYQSIREHEQNNPDFNNIKLVIFHEASMLKLRSEDSFEIIGTYSDEAALKKLLKSIAANGGVWCPEQNALIGNTRDTCMCDRFAEFTQRPAVQSKKFKK